ncbi:MAG: transporter substrate-binding domain-containing protein [Actinomycetota bacterium]
MRIPRFRAILVLVAALSLVAAACGGDGEGGGGDGNGGAPVEKDLLATILEEGVLTVSTDPAYPPQSFLNEDTGEYEGFDIDVATEIANRLGVDIAWEAPAWESIISGSWNGRWDLSVGSMTVTPERAEVLFFTTAYYYTPASVAVHADNTSVTDISTDLDGAKIGVCGGCTYDSFLQGTLEIPGYTFDFIIDGPAILTYDTDSTAIQDLSLGDGTRLDAVISAQPTLEAAIEKGKPIKIVGDPVFYEPLAVAIDRSSQLDPTSFFEQVSEIVVEMHADGTLTALSLKWYGVDLTVQV